MSLDQMFEVRFNSNAPDESHIVYSLKLSK